MSRAGDTGGQSILVIEGLKGLEWPTRGMEAVGEAPSSPEGKLDTSGERSPTILENGL